LEKTLFLLVMMGRVNARGNVKSFIWERALRLGGACPF
jgi:hypothetical protein